MSSMDGLFVSARSRTEYEGMFDLSFDRWAGKQLLDCAAGGASFVAEWCAAGGQAVACDPLYGESFAFQEEAVRSGVDRAAKNIVDEPHLYVWDVFGTPERHKAARIDAAETFLLDIRRFPERYFAGSLPQLPFPNRTFDLVLVSHLLFVYSRTISVDEHIAYVRELARVAVEEVRIYPLIGFEGDAGGVLACVVGALEDSGCVCQRRPSPYHFLKGATEYLAIRLPRLEEADAA